MISFESMEQATLKRSPSSDNLFRLEQLYPTRSPNHSASFNNESLHHETRPSATVPEIQHHRPHLLDRLTACFCCILPCCQPRDHTPNHSHMISVSQNSPSHSESTSEPHTPTIEKNGKTFYDALQMLEQRVSRAEKILTCSAMKP